MNANPFLKLSRRPSFFAFRPVVVMRNATLGSILGLLLTSVWATEESLLDFKSLTFSRASTATEVDAEGHVYAVGSDVLRHAPDGWAHLEGPRSQMILWNEDFSKGVWSRTNCTLASEPGVTAPDGSTAQALVATAVGDAYVDQTLSLGGGPRVNFWIYARPTAANQKLLLSVYGGSVTEAKTIDLATGWRHVDVLARNTDGAVHVRVGISNARPGERVLIWGADLFMAGTARVGGEQSHFPTQSSIGHRAKDELVAQPEQIPARMLSGVGGAWGFRWRPSYGWDEHNDSSFFSVKNLSHECLWVAGPNTQQKTVTGRIWVRGTEGNATTKSESQEITFQRGDTIEVHLNPANGHLRVTGARTGNGRGSKENPWAWPSCETMRIGDRNVIEVHPTDSFLSEPFAVDPF
jgi:hypothetical protein